MWPFFRSRFLSFRFAFEGWWYVIRTQRNAWIHATISFAVIITSILLDLSFRDWAVLTMAIALVWMAEFLNTALEAVVDLTSPEKHKLAKVCKDVGAAAVLIAAVSAILIGLLILGPPIWDALREISVP